jgi:hypothetical protein
MSEDIKPVAWRAANWSDTVDEFCYYDHDDRPICGTGLTGEGLYSQGQIDALRAALQEADTIMGHADEATEWREKWSNLWPGFSPGQD